MLEYFEFCIMIIIRREDFLHPGTGAEVLELGNDQRGKVDQDAQQNILDSSLQFKMSYSAFNCAEKNNLNLLGTSANSSF